jgi:hypothetical protein
VTLLALQQRLELLETSPRGGELVLGMGEVGPSG